VLMAAIEFVGVGCQVGLGAMFLWSGAAKLWDVAPFQSTIRSLGLSPQVASTSAATVIIAELVLGMFATTGWVPIPTSVGIALLLLLFAGVAVYANCYLQLLRCLALQIWARGPLFGLYCSCYRRDISPGPSLRNSRQGHSPTSQSRESSYSFAAVYWFGSSAPAPVLGRLPPFRTLLMTVSVWLPLSNLILATTIVAVGLMVSNHHRKLARLEAEFLRIREPVPVEHLLQTNELLPPFDAIRASDRQPVRWSGGNATVIVLNAVCAPCRSVADELSALPAGSPLESTLVIIEGAEKDLAGFAVTGILTNPTTLLVEPETIERWLGRSVSPLVAIINTGKLVRAAQVHSATQIIKYVERLDLRPYKPVSRSPLQVGHPANSSS